MTTTREDVRDARVLMDLCERLGVDKWRDLPDDEVCRALNRSPLDVQAMKARPLSSRPVRHRQSAHPRERDAPPGRD